ncbi:hypothetical protein C8R44DRAFT_879260 [Mycena epipterygia]|nr:hypothetical protein C8R44DRAFT_879260 [Mycena epipterygia]
MKVRYLIHTTVSSAGATLLKFGNDVRDILNAKADFKHLSYTISLLEGELATLRTAAVGVLHRNHDLEGTVHHLTEQADQANSAAAYYSGMATDQQAVIDFGVSQAQLLLEDTYRSEARARDVQGQLLEDSEQKDELLRRKTAQIESLLQSLNAAHVHIAALESKVADDTRQYNADLLKSNFVQAARDISSAHAIDQARETAALKDELLREQAAQIHSLLQSANAAQDRIASLESKVVDDAHKHRVDLLESGRVQAARDLAHTQSIDAQSAKTSALEILVRDLKTAAIASQTAEVARAKTDAKTIRKKSRRIAEVEANVVRLEARATQAEAKNIKNSKTVAEQAADIADLKARVKELEVEAVVVWAGERAEQKRLEQRALLAEQRVVFLEDEKISTADKTKATITRLAVLHAKELVAARTRNAADVDDNSIDVPATPATMIPEAESTTTAPTVSIASSSSQDFSLDCRYHFSTRFVVRSDSAFAQASIAEPGHFVKDARKIVRRGGNSYMTPLLLPAWPECSGRVEDSRSLKRVKRA